MKLLEYKDYSLANEFKITRKVIETLISYDMKRYGLYVSPDGNFIDENNEYYEIDELFGRKTPAEKAQIQKQKEIRDKLKMDKKLHKGNQKIEKEFLKRQKWNSKRSGLKVANKPGKLEPFTKFGKVDVKDLGNGKKGLFTGKGKILAIGAIATGALLLLANVLRKKFALKKKIEQSEDPNQEWQDNLDALMKREAELKDKIRAANAEAKQDETTESYIFNLNENFIDDINYDIDLFEEAFNDSEPIFPEFNIDLNSILKNIS